MTARNVAVGTLCMVAIVLYDGSAQPPLEALLSAAQAGSERAWVQLVDQFIGLVWSIARSFDLDHHDAADVVQTTWLQLARSLHTIREPERLGLWLATATRRECLRARTRARKVVAVDALVVFERRSSDAAAPEDDILEREHRRQCWQALQQMPERCRSLLRALVADPSPSYAEVAEALGIPVGSIGPQRQRCLHALRGKLSPV